MKSTESIDAPQEQMDWIAVGVLAALLASLLYFKPFTIEDKRDFELREHAKTNLSFADSAGKLGLEFTHHPRIPQREPRSASNDALSGLAASVAVGDYNGDGFQDLAVVSPTDGESKLFRNVDGTGFMDVTESEIPTLRNGLFATTVAWMDFDEDGQLDLLVGTVTGLKIFLNKSKVSPRFIEHFEHEFENQLAVSNINLVDFNLDGHLDLLISAFWRSGIEGVSVGALPWNFQSTGGGFRLYESRGRGQYSLVYDSPHKSHVVGTALGRLDESRVIYFLTGNDFETMGIFTYQDGRWNDLSYISTRLDTGYWNSGLSVGDIDEDGITDIYQSNTRASPVYKSRNNILNINSNRSGLRHTVLPIKKCGFSWGSLMEDFDNNGLLELVVANGLHRAAVQPESPAGEFLWTIRTSSRSTPFFWRAITGNFDWARFSAAGEQKKCLFQKSNEGWSDVGEGAGVLFDNPARSVAKIDFNNDGRWDLVFLSFNGPLKFYENKTTLATKWLGLKFSREQDAYGAEVVWQFGGKVRKKINWPSNGTSVQNDVRMILPVDSSTRDIEVLFNDGRRKQITLTQMDTYVEVK